jgi:mycothiol synthase
MRRPLPLEPEVVAEISDFTTEPFEPGRDEQQWLDLNNAAFAQHPEQGGWTMDTLNSRMQQEWFDVSGFRVHRRNDVIASFCWTKIHHENNIVMGEIYVIAVQPDLAGQGLGRKIAIAGLDAAFQKGADYAMLYVDADNASAVAMYGSLGFSVHHEEHSFVGNIAAEKVTS